MKINKNDPRLTSYALNELEADEKLLIEKALESDIELQKELAYIKKSIAVFDQLEKQEAYRLEPEQREKVFAKNKKTAWWPVFGALVTASLALVIYQKTNFNSYEKMGNTQAKNSSDSSLYLQEAAPKLAAPAAPKAKAMLAAPTTEPETETASQVVADSARDEASNIEMKGRSRSGSPDSFAGVVAQEQLGSGGSASSGGAAAKPSAPALALKNETMAEGQVAARGMGARETVLAAKKSFAPTSDVYVDKKTSDYEISVMSLKENNFEVLSLFNSQIKILLKQCVQIQFKQSPIDLSLNLVWQIQSSQVKNFSMSRADQSRDNLPAELTECFQTAFATQNWNGIKDDVFKLNIKVVSK